MNPLIIYFLVVVILFLLLALFAPEDAWQDSETMPWLTLAILFWPLTIPVTVIIGVLVKIMMFVREKTEKFRKRMYSKDKGVKFE